MVIVQRLEADLRALSQVTFKNTNPAVEPTDVVVFSRSRDFYNFAPAELGGIFYRGLPIKGADPSHLVVTYGGLDESTRTTLMHELTHDLFARNFGPAPPWLDEGWAQFYSTITIKDGQLRIGEPLPDLTFTEESSPFLANAKGRQVIAIPIADVAAPSALLQWTSDDFSHSSKHAEPRLDEVITRSGRYLGAWALIHMLTDGNNPYSERYRAFQEQVRNRSVEHAWSRAFSGIKLEVFDRDFRSYLREGRLTVHSLPYDAGLTAPLRKKRTLADAEVHALWARLHVASSSHFPEGLAQASAELRAATQSDAQFPEPYYYRALLAHDRNELAIARSEIERARDLSPDDPRFILTELHIQLEQAGDKLSEEEARLFSPRVESLARAENSPRALLFAARYFLSFGERERAIELAHRAVTQSPVDPFVLNDCALILEQAGELDEAVEHQRAAIAFLNEGHSVSAPLREDLARMEASRARGR